MSFGHCTTNIDKPPMADEIAWAASDHSWRGECESSLPCYLGSRRGFFLNGKLEYLKRHPDGKHRVKAASLVLDMLGSLFNIRNEYTCRRNRFDVYNPEVRERRIRDYYAELEEKTDAIATVIEAAHLDITTQNAVKGLLDGLASPCIWTR